MGNQASQGSRRISSESNPMNASTNHSSGISVSAEPSPKRPNSAAFAKADPESGKLELPERVRRHSDAAKGESRSPSPTQRSRARTVTANTASPRVAQRHAVLGNADAVARHAGVGGLPRTPRLAFKKFQVTILVLRQRDHFSAYFKNTYLGWFFIRVANIFNKRHPLRSLRSSTQ
jgi:hypothetical protein